MPPGASISTTDSRSHAGARERSRPEAAQANLWVHWAVCFSLFSIPYYELYLPGTGERVGLKRISQLLILAAMITRPWLCLRFLPRALLWFAAYCGYRLLAGIWLAPGYQARWWPPTFELLQYYLPWAWLLFNAMRYPGLARRSLWAFTMGATLCAALHCAGIGAADVDHGAEGRSTVFGQNANQIGEIYALAAVVLVALGMFRHARPQARMLVFPMIGILAFGLAKTGSRTGALLLAMGTALLLPQTRALVSRTRRYLTFLLLGLVLAGVLYQIPTIVTRLAPVASSSAAREEARGRMIPVLWDMFTRSPWFGSGPDRYQLELTRRAMPYLIDEQHRTIVAHNLPLLLMVETGLLGLFLFAMGTGRALLAAWRAREGACGLLPLACLLPVCLAGMTVSSPIFEPIFWFSVAFGLAGSSIPGEYPPNLAV